MNSLRCIILCSYIILLKMALGQMVESALYSSETLKAGESQPRAPGQNSSRLSRWLFLIAINERIASELLARNRRITDKNAVFAEKTIEKIVNFTFGMFYDR